MEIDISKESNPEKKAQLQSLLDEHRRDAELVRDFIYWCFQKSYHGFSEKKCMPKLN